MATKKSLKQSKKDNTKRRQKKTIKIKKTGNERKNL